MNDIDDVISSTPVTTYNNIDNVNWDEVNSTMLSAASVKSEELLKDIDSMLNTTELSQKPYDQLLETVFGKDHTFSNLLNIQVPESFCLTQAIEPLKKQEKYVQKEILDLLAQKDLNHNDLNFAGFTKKVDGKIIVDMPKIQAYLELINYSQQAFELFNEKYDSDQYKNDEETAKDNEEYFKSITRALIYKSYEFGNM